MAVASTSTVNSSRGVFDANRIADQQQQQRNVQQARQDDQQRQQDQVDNRNAAQRTNDTAFRSPGTGSNLDKFA